MNKPRFWKTLPLLLACAAWIAPPQLLAGPPVATSLPPGKPQVIRDVALDASGRLHGQLVDPAGKGRSERTVALRRPGEKLRHTTTERDGAFSIGPLQGGVYEISTPSASGVYRLWSYGTAPPSASRSLLLVEHLGLKRGQQPLEQTLFGDPVLTGLVIGAAVAIPIIIHNNNDRPND